MQAHRVVSINTSPSHKHYGFTLIELMLVVAIIGILSAISLPAYTNYILKGKIKAAQADLVALSLHVENYYQRRLSYPASGTADTAATKALFSGWSPAQGSDFKYELTNASSTKYTVKATGTSSALTGCILTLDQTNARTASECLNLGTTW
ncbi:type IV pilin protein [Denitrificimonas caeni]|uniref:type IV pilin protein n=1 Tax=Denitrificimonas caeni TaxID=521720 RepID=UPI0019653408|nr:type IV pilin protein [Denitrificimonas caeni]